MPAEKTEDDSSSSSIADSPFFQRTAESHAEPSSDAKPLIHSDDGTPLATNRVYAVPMTPVPVEVGGAEGTAEDAEQQYQGAKSGLVDPSALQVDAARKEALAWGRNVDLFFATMGGQVDPLINPSPDDGEATPAGGDAPIPDNGLSDPPKPSLGPGAPGRPKQ